MPSNTKRLLSFSPFSLSGKKAEAVFVGIGPVNDWSFSFGKDVCRTLRHVLRFIKQAAIIEN